MTQYKKIHMVENISIAKSPRSRKSSIVTFVPGKIRQYFDIKNGDELIWNIMGNNIVINVIKHEKSENKNDNIDDKNKQHKQNT